MMIYIFFLHPVHIREGKERGLRPHERRETVS